MAKKRIVQHLFNAVLTLARVYVISLAIVALLTVLFRLFTGEHPECAFNVEVGPCALQSWVWSSLSQSGLIMAAVFLPIGILTDISLLKFLKKRK